MVTKKKTGEFYDAFLPYVDQITVNPLIDYLYNDKDIVYINSFACPVLWQRMVIGYDANHAKGINSWRSRIGLIIPLIEYIFKMVKLFKMSFIRNKLGEKSEKKDIIYLSFYR